MSISLSEIRDASESVLIEASTRFRSDQIQAYEQAIEREAQENAKWIMSMILDNARIAERKKLPLCDDTGVPHVLLEVGRSCRSAPDVCSILHAVRSGIAAGLKKLPGRPMAVRGEALERIAQSGGLFDDPSMVVPAPIRIKDVDGNRLGLHVLMLGGGPEIRSRTSSVFHYHSASCVRDQIARWAVEMAGLLGCTPCVPAAGIGRTHYEATSLMLDALTFGTFGHENELEHAITTAINSTREGPLGVGGNVTALNTFVETGPQRASGVRIVSLRLGCCFDPRKSMAMLQ